MAIGRRVVNVAQKARGREPIKYEFEVIPYTAWEIPAEYDKLLFAWERGSKLFVTDAEDVRPNRAVFWKQFLKQTATMYKSNGEFEKKDFSFKLQSVKANAKGAEDRKTVAKIHIDLSAFCTGQMDPRPVEKCLQLKPFGKLKVSIKASWLKDAKVDGDAMTEMSGPSMFTDNQGEDPEEPEEQDLSGFDNGHASTSGRGRHSGEGEEYGDDGEQRPRRSRRSKKGGPRSRNGTPLPEEIPEGTEEVPDDEDLAAMREARRRKRRQRQQQGEEGDPGEDAAGQAQPEMQSGQRVQRGTWREHICCCCQPKVTEQPNEPQEGDQLLSTQQKAAMPKLNINYRR